MPEILVFSPPDVYDSQNLISGNLVNISGILKEKGYDHDQKSLYVDLKHGARFRGQSNIDLSALRDDEKMSSYLRGGEDKDIQRTARKLGEELSIESYDIVIAAVFGAPIYSKGYRSIASVIPIIRECGEDQKVIIAGSCSFEDLELADLPYIDYVIEGDVEIPLENILSHEIDGEELEIDPGIRCFRDGELLKGEPYIHPPDEKPCPNYDSEIVNKHSEISFLDSPVVKYEFGYGCKDPSNYDAVFRDDKYRYKSIEKVVRGLKDIKEDVGVKNFRFADYCLFNDPEKIKEFAKELKRQELDISWSGTVKPLSRPQSFFDLISESGCTALHLDIGTISEKGLEKMERAEKPEMIYDTLEKAYRAGIDPFGYLRIGYPDETREEYEETLNFMKKNPHLMGAQIREVELLPTQNLPLYRKHEDYDIEILEDPDDRDRAQKLLDCSLDYRYENSEIEETGKQREKRISEAQRHADLHLFLSNYGRTHPVTFTKKIIRKIYTKDHNDITYSFAER